MRIGILGLGYVGLTSAGCLLKEGHSIIGVEPSAQKVEAIRTQRSPIFEPGLETLLVDGLRAGRMEVMTFADSRLAACDLILVCVGTPSAADGSQDASQVVSASCQIADALRYLDRRTPLPVVYRCTLTPGSIDLLVQPVFAAQFGADVGSKIELIYNPEFMRESSAVDDYFHPAKIVVGTIDGRPSPILIELYKNIEAPTFVATFAEAELSKFVDNAWHAVKVAYANEIGRTCSRLGISAARIHEIFIGDTKLNMSSRYCRPGGPFGGSCLPKDLRALSFLSNKVRSENMLLGAAIQSNEAHKRFLYEYCTTGLQPGASILMIGLAFKPETDDLRESPKVDMARDLIKAGFRLSILDRAIEPDRLVGQNRLHANSILPGLAEMLITLEKATAAQYDLVIDTFGSAGNISLTTKRLVDINSLS